MSGILGNPIFTKMYMSLLLWHEGRHFILTGDGGYQRWCGKEPKQQLLNVIMETYARHTTE